MTDFNTTLRFEIIGNQFKDSNEFYNYLQEVFARDRTVLRMVDVKEYCHFCGKKQ